MAHPHLFVNSLAPPPPPRDCPTYILLSFLVQKVQKLEISMPAQCHYFDELLLTMIKREHFFYSTAVDLYQCLFSYVRNRHFRRVLFS